MSTIDEIMCEVTSLGSMRIMATQGRSERDDVWDQHQAVQRLITAAIADAEKRGAEAMRAEAAAMCRSMADRLEGKAQASEADEPDDVSALRATAWKLLLASDGICALPLPTGQRQAVRLTDERIAMAMHAWSDQDPEEFDFEHWRNNCDAQELIELAKVIETAVLAKNGLGDAT